MVAEVAETFDDWSCGNLREFRYSRRGASSHIAVAETLSEFHYCAAHDAERRAALRSPKRYASSVLNKWFSMRKLRLCESLVLCQ